MFDDILRYKNLYCRYDKGIGFFAYNESNGLIYAVAEDSFLGEGQEPIPLSRLAAKLKRKYRLDDPRNFSQLLPDASSWPGPPQERLRHPLTVNWLISKHCTHHCQYCYADDIVGNESVMDDVSVGDTAKHILSLRPLNVVLSGGEPFLSDQLSEAIEHLAGRTGIVIDTNGFCFDAIKALLPVIKKYKIHVRISLDSLRTKLQSKIRPVRDKLPDQDVLGRIVESVCLLLSNGVHITIHTVLTKENANDLLGMGDKLWKLGIHNWRIFELQICNEKMKRELAFSDTDDRIARQNKYFVDRVIRRSQNNWPSLRISYTPANGNKNNVVLVLPDGTFHTEGKHGAGKILIDPVRPRAPTIDSFQNFSWGEHFTRYIG